MLTDDQVAAFPGWHGLDPQTRDILARTCVVTPLDAGALLFEPGQAPERYLLVLAGSVRVHLLDETGHEIVLYRLAPGDSCVLTTAALLGRTPYAAYALTETGTLAAAVPKPIFEALIADSASFRDFVFRMHGRRIAGLLQTVCDVAFASVQTRLARVLLARADPLGFVHMTHEAIALEMGSAREVVSRKLKAFETDGRVRLDRGVLQIIDPPGLVKLAAGATA